ncbi:MAG TPA: ribose-5-phosphate isomerase RpiA [Tepidisphaeraceae bacterium]|jgi:ribose 5-phosphate isomerase A|nr:ribose-5-phosphate isomerase RpiA [Tepidisphaeraceae bacterium]
MNPKQRAAEAALPFIKDGMIVGLGTGSTTDYFIDALGAALRAGQLKSITGIPTSVASEQRARRLGIPLSTLAQYPATDITVDGADEVDPQLNLIKGLGGALLREKIVGQNSRKLIIVADSTKSVPALGSKSPLPVEVVPFCHESHVAFFRSLGGEPVLRMNFDGTPFLTDNHNFIYDTRFARINDPAALDVALKHRAGIVEHGLFIGLANVVLIGTENGVEQRVRSA